MEVRWFVGGLLVVGMKRIENVYGNVSGSESVNEMKCGREDLEEEKSRSLALPLHYQSSRRLLGHRLRTAPVPLQVRLVLLGSLTRNWRD